MCSFLSFLNRYHTKGFLWCCWFLQLFRFKLCNKDFKNVSIFVSIFSSKLISFITISLKENHLHFLKFTNYRNYEGSREEWTVAHGCHSTMRVRCCHISCSDRFYVEPMRYTSVSNFHWYVIEYSSELPIKYT